MEKTVKNIVWHNTFFKIKNIKQTLRTASHVSIKLYMCLQIYITNI